MKKEAKYIFSFYSPIIKRFWKRMFFVSFLLIFASLLLLPFPFIMKYIIDVILPNKDITSLIIVVFFLFVIYLFNVLYNYFLTKVNTRLDNDILIDMRMNISKKLEKIDNSFFYEKERSKIFYAYIDNIENAQNILSTAFSTAFIAFSSIIFGIAAMLIMDLKMTMLCLLVLPFYVLAVKKSSNKIVREQDKLNKKRTLLYSSINGFIRTINLIKSQTIEIRENLNLKEDMKKHAREVYNFAKLSTLISQVTWLISSVGPLIVLLYGGYQIILGNLSLGSLIAFLSFLSYTFGPSATLVDLSINIKRVIPDIKSIREILNFKEEPRKLGKTEMKSGEIEFKKVDFEILDKPILKNISLKIKEGDFVAIIGKSGSGKSSILKLIEGFWYPTKGNVLVGEENTKLSNIRELRKEIGYVEQEPIMLKRSLYDNITLGRNISKARFNRIIEMTNLEKLIKVLPNKEQTIVNPDYFNFSRGQIQRISIARNLILGKRILLLDEFSSSLDPRTERDILKTIENLKGGLTVIMVTHHKDSLKKADKIFVLDNGRIAEQGTYHSLKRRRDSKFNEIFSKLK